MTLYRYENGYCLSIINNGFSYGLEAALGHWWIRKNTISERFIDWLTKEHPTRIIWDFVKGNLLKHESFNGNVYAYLNSGDLVVLKERTKQLPVFTSSETKVTSRSDEK
jgi:hypothetical protein